MQALKEYFFQEVKKELFDKLERQVHNPMGYDLHNFSLALSYIESIVEVKYIPFSYSYWSYLKSFILKVFALSIFFDSKHSSAIGSRLEFYSKSYHLKKFQQDRWKECVMFVPFIGEFVYHLMCIIKGKNIDSFVANRVRFLQNSDSLNQTFQFLKNMQIESIEWIFLHETIKEFYQTMSDRSIQHRFSPKIVLSDSECRILKIEGLPLSVKLYEQNKFLISRAYSSLVKNSNTNGFLHITNEFLHIKKDFICFTY